MMAAMLAELTDGEFPSILLKALFLKCLPAEIKRLLFAPRNVDSLRAMAEYVYRLWDGRHVQF